MTDRARVTELAFEFVVAIVRRHRQRSDFSR
jgi:hypothetical protein